MKVEFDITIVPNHALEFYNSNPNWSAQKEYNYMFIRSTAEYMQMKLAAQSYLFLNDVLKALGFPPTPEGQVCGWLSRNGQLVIKAHERPDGTGNIWITFEDQGVIVNDI